MSDENISDVPTTSSLPSRRRFIAGAGAIGAGAWIAPAVLHLDVAAAATSVPACGLPFAVNFNADTPTDQGAGPGLNQVAFVDWTVTAGSVDLIGQGTGYDPYHSSTYTHYVDLDGTTSQSGQLTSKCVFPTVPKHTYTVTLVLATNPFQGPEEQVNVSFGGSTQLIDVSGLSTPTAVPLTFVATGTSSTLVVDNLVPLSANDNNGPYLFAAQIQG